MADRPRFAQPLDLANQEGPSQVEANAAEAKAFYDSYRWRKTRERALNRDKRLCQHCIKRGRTTLAKIVHHIKKRLEYPELAFRLDNLTSLCWPCHSKLDRDSR